MSQNTIQVKVKKINEKAVIPQYAHNGDVGMDLTAISVEYDVKNDMYIYHTGLSFESDFNYGQFLFPRSSNRKTDAYLCNHVGIADSAIYRGEIMLCFKNRTSTNDLIRNIGNEVFENAMRESNSCSAESVMIDLMHAYKVKREKEEELFKNIEEFALSNKPYEVGDRIAQMVFLKYPTVELIETTKLSETDRGAGGFGSTGK